MATLIVYPTGIFGNGVSDGSRGGDSKILKNALKKAKEEGYDTIVLKATNEQGEYCPWNISKWFIEDGDNTPWLRVYEPDLFPNLKLIDYSILDPLKFDDFPWHASTFIFVDFPVSILGEDLHKNDDEGLPLKTTLVGVTFEHKDNLNYYNGMDSVPFVKIINGERKVYEKRFVHNEDYTEQTIEEVPMTFMDGTISFKNLRLKKCCPAIFRNFFNIKEFELIDSFFDELTQEEWYGSYPEFISASPFIWMNCLSEAQQVNPPPPAFQYTLDPNLATFDENGKPVEAGITLCRRLDKAIVKGCKFQGINKPGAMSDMIKFITAGTTLEIETKIKNLHKIYLFI